MTWRGEVQWEMFFFTFPNPYPLSFSSLHFLRTLNALIGPNQTNLPVLFLGLTLLWVRVVAIGHLSQKSAPCDWPYGVRERERERFRRSWMFKLNGDVPTSHGRVWCHLSGEMCHSGSYKCVCVCVSEFSLCSKQDVLSSMLLLWSGQPARRNPQKTTSPLSSASLSISVAHSHPHTHTHTNTQSPHASLNTMGICPTPPSHLAKNTSFGVSDMKIVL